MMETGFSRYSTKTGAVKQGISSKLNEIRITEIDNIMNKLSYLNIGGGEGDSGGQEFLLGVIRSIEDNKEWIGEDATVFAEKMRELRQKLLNARKWAEGMMGVMGRNLRAQQEAAKTAVSKVQSIDIKL